MTQNNNPLVSVIVTTYNRKDLLSTTINSILKQTYSNFELIIIDNFSDYNFPDFIAAFKDDRIIHFQNNNNGVIAINRNYGINQAKCDFLAFCDDDDYWVEDKLEQQIKHIINDKSIIGVGTNAYLFGKVNRLKRPELKDDTLLRFENIVELKSNILSSLLIRKGDCFFDESEEMRYTEDFEFGLQLVHKSGKPIKLLAKPLVYYRLHESNNISILNNSINSINAINKYQKYIPQNQLTKLYSKTYTNLGSLAILDKPFESRKYYILSMKYGSFNIKLAMLLVISFFPRLVKKMLVN
jgi:teichuronic acid biosynthesis glycosyltransferase TuaG